MKKTPLLILLILLLTSCATTTFFKEKINLEQLLAAKHSIESTDNIAKQLLLKNDLNNKVVSLQNLPVKDLVSSSLVDYDFCVISQVETPEGPVEIYIYTKNIRALSRIERGKSLINVEGEFSRFFTTLDQYYVKIEIINSRIKIKGIKDKSAESEKDI